MNRTVEFLQGHLLLHAVPEQELEKAAAAMFEVEFHPGDSLIREGAVGDCCYFILSGEALVSTHNLTGKPIVLDVLKAGSLLGEIALIMQEKRTADVKAMGKVKALCLKTEAFTRLSEASPLFYESLLYSARIRLVHGLLRKATVWSAIEDKELRGLAEITEWKKVAQGETIIREGSQSEHIYMIARGRFEVRLSGRRETVLGSGDCFGEADLLLGGPHTGHVTALENGELLIMGREEFHYILQQYEHVRRQLMEMVRLRYPELGASVEAERTASDPGLGTDTQGHAADSARKARAGKDRWIDRVLVFGGLFILFTVCAVWLQQPVWIAAALLTGGLTGPVAYVSYVRSSQLLGYRVPRLVLSFVLSAATAVPAAWFIERQWVYQGERGELAFGPLGGPLAISLIEEIVKLLVCLLLLRGQRKRFIMDALVFGAAVGMGFAAAENMLYGWDYLQSGTTTDMLAVLWVRTLLSPFGHGTWTAIAAAGLWYGLRHRSGGASYTIWNGCGKMAGLLGASILLHALWDYHYNSGLLRLAAMLIIGAAGLMLLYRLLQRGMREETQALMLLNPDLEQRQERHSEAQTALTDLLPVDRNLQSLVCGGCGTLSPQDASYCARCGLALHAPVHVDN
ncbi:cyclic nucleotide-binding domain-containing protein [Paenibacillus sp. GCM10012307]|uniref:Cyclic nucleotide-binding domain-containing protein n=1 Tax=Paenibacillus roseus TaxID=2798579 RepID=A0A934J418_9BACL|nr:cyclic nucleotide-binding domain-containing protein [Paenibacillus roseus]MBJ6362445.1 cyclic nucleotide-binding domain-containing protein [Paenibacillus roseus]